VSQNLEDSMIRTLSITLATLLGFGPPIPEGTDIPVTVDENIPITRERFGESFEAHVTRDVVLNGKVVIPEGAPAEVKLVESPEKSDAATLRLSKIRLDGEMREVTTDAAEADSEKSGLDTKERTAVGAAAGAVVGAVTGAGVVKGAIVGAGGGLAWSLLDKDRQVDEGTPVQFSLEEEVR
jgi:hypothetical protein